MGDKEKFSKWGIEGRDGWMEGGAQGIKNPPTKSPPPSRKPSPFSSPSDLIRISHFALYRPPICFSHTPFPPWKKIQEKKKAQLKNGQNKAFPIPVCRFRFFFFITGGVDGKEGKGRKK